MVLSVPTIDISALRASNDVSEKSKVIQQIGDACEQWGFFYVVNHGVDLDLVEKATTLGKLFFHMPKEIKDKVARSEVSVVKFKIQNVIRQLICK